MRVANTLKKGSFNNLTSGKGGYMSLLSEGVAAAAWAADSCAEYELTLGRGVKMLRVAAGILEAYGRG